MEREEFKVLVKGMRAVYPQDTFIPDADAFNVWYELLKDLPYIQVNTAIQKYMLTEKFPPTIADIRTKAAEISYTDSSMSELEAWNIVHKAIRNSGYHADEEFEKLPEACKIAVGNPAILREWALMESDKVTTIEQSHFIRNYRTAVKRIEEERKLPESIKQLIGKVRDEVSAIPAKSPERLKESTRDELPDNSERAGVPMPEWAKTKMKELMGGNST